MAGKEGTTMYKEVSVILVKEILRLWLMGMGKKPIADRAGVDPKTVRRYIDAARAEGLWIGMEGHGLTEEVLGAVLARLSPGRAQQHGEAHKVCELHRKAIERMLGDRMTLVKVRRKLAQQGIAIPYSALYRFAKGELDFRKDSPTVRVNDGAPGEEVQVDFGKMGLLWDPEKQSRRLLRAFIFTPNVSRYRFVWPCWRETTQDVIEACEAAWEFYEGVFKVLIPDNTKAIVIKADPLSPILNEAFLEYAQARAFLVDPTRTRRPRDKGRVEATVAYVRRDWFVGEEILGLEDARRSALHWSSEVAGGTIHRTTQRIPREHFGLVEKAALLPKPTEPYDIPLWKDAKVHPDQHIEFMKALYSVPMGYVGCKVRVRGDSRLVHIYRDRQVIKTHPRMAPGGRSTDPLDYPEHKRAYAMRDIKSLLAKAETQGPSIGILAAHLLSVALPWTRMRSVYKLLRLVQRYGAERVEQGAKKCLDHEMHDVKRLQRMLDAGIEASQKTVPLKPMTQLPLRFTRSPEEYKIGRKEMIHE